MTSISPFVLSVFTLSFLGRILLPHIPTTYYFLENSWVHLDAVPISKTTQANLENLFQQDTTFKAQFSKIGQQISNQNLLISKEKDDILVQMSILGFVIIALLIIIIIVGSCCLDTLNDRLR